MKKYLLILALALFALSANAKRTQATLSTDPNLHVGKLPNGLTYYILRNNTPPQSRQFLPRPMRWLAARERQPTRLGPLLRASLL